MQTAYSTNQLRKQRGQILIVAIIILGVLLIIGFTFASILSRNLNFAGRSRQRTVASDLAEAGIRYAHYQLINSELGADWRPEPSLPPTDAAGFTKDPDALYLRAGSGFPLRNRVPTDQVVDQGGPDGLGPYTRVNYERGRALIRVRYSPSDFNVFSAPTGALRQPGKARYYLIVEAVGRPGRINANDPSLLLSESVRVANFANPTDFYQQYDRLKKVDTRNVDSRQIVAFASIGIIESARFITNKFHVTAPAEIGSITPPISSTDAGPSKDSLGVSYEGQNVAVPSFWGGGLIRNDGTALATGTGSLYCNADLVIHGRHTFLMNPNIGDIIACAGSISGANDAAQIAVTNTATVQTITLGNNTNPSFNSQKDSFSTAKGLVRDGSSSVDQEEYPRSIGYKTPPSILGVDPASNVNKYIVMSRQSGPIVNDRNIGQFGYGRNIYIDCAERGNRSFSDEREASEVVRALPTDWLNPNNTSSIGWQGPYYRPVAAYVRLLPDGFEITRDSRSARRYWRNANGSNSATATVKFRLREVNGRTYIINGILNPTLIDQPGTSLTDNQFVQFGQVFGGVIVCEGDVQVRGVIPTNRQLTVVSLGSIYINGSITKGVVDENGTLLSTPSRSMLALLARDYVALNTTAFFAPVPGEDPKPKNADSLPSTPNAVELDPGEKPDMVLGTQFLLDPNTPIGLGGNPFNPTTWRPFPLIYTEFGSGNRLASNAILMQSADAGGPTFIGLDVAARTFADTAPPITYWSSYMFQRQISFGAAGNIDFNLAGDPSIFPPAYGTTVPIYGLGNPSIHAYPKFETVAFPLIEQPSFSQAGRKLVPTAGYARGQYQLALQDETLFNLKLSSAGPYAPKNYELARTAITPYDVRIEAAMYAEEGSFFVIPGPEFNTNPDDTREAFATVVAQAGLPTAQRNRFEQFGMMPEAPFFGEPLDVRVSIVGSVSENMPAPISQQAAWQRKWGWIPRAIGGTGNLIPSVHVPPGFDISSNDRYVPNLSITFDPALALASADGVGPIRTVVRNGVTYALPPMPRLPVSPTLVYFGEVNP